MRFGEDEHCKKSTELEVRHIWDQIAVDHFLAMWASPGWVYCIFVSLFVQWE